jgi:hypothetical protein
LGGLETASKVVVVPAGELKTRYYQINKSAQKSKRLARKWVPRDGVDFGTRSRRPWNCSVFVG